MYFSCLREKVREQFLIFGLRTSCVTEVNNNINKRVGKLTTTNYEQKSLERDQVREGI